MPPSILEEVSPSSCLWTLVLSGTHAVLLLGQQHLMAELYGRRAVKKEKEKIPMGKKYMRK